MANSAATSSARLNCLCGAISIPGTYLEESSFPIPDTICHCQDCRWVSGGLVPSFPSLKTAPPQDVLDKLAVYKSSDRCNRYFCSKCGSHCFVEHPQVENEWYCNGGIIDPPENAGLKDVIRIEKQMYIEGTVDGGVAPLFLNIDTDATDALWRQRVGDGPLRPEELVDMARKATQHPLPEIEEKLTVKCHCGGVHMLVDRANYKENPHQVKPRLIPSNPDKYYAWYCTCRSCRLATGYSLQPMAYVPPGAIRNARSKELVAFGDAAIKDGANKGLTLKHYRHTDTAQRSFCSTCGATVFYTYLGNDGDGVVDISVGILGAESGSLAREWLEWKEGHISHEEEMVDRSQSEAVRQGWKALRLAQ